MFKKLFTLLLSMRELNKKQVDLWTALIFHAIYYPNYCNTPKLAYEICLSVCDGIKDGFREWVRVVYVIF